MRHTFTLAASVLTLTLATSAFAQEEPVVNVYNWSDYIAEDTIAKFEEETGITVNYDVYDNNEIVEAKLLAGSSGYDVVVPTGFYLERQINAGLLQKLDKSKLSNLGNMDPDIVEQAAAHDPGNEYSVDYMWGTTGIGYNVAEVRERLGEDADLDTWDLIFDPETAAKLADCGISMLDAPADVYATALNYLGLPPNSEDPEHLAQAEELLKSVRPHIRYYHSSQYIDDLGNGETCVAMGYSGDVFIAQAAAEEAGQGVEIGYTIPAEGALIWFDLFAIPVDAPHPDNAHKFIDFMLRADIAAANTNYVYYASGNEAALPMIEDDVKNDPSIYPTPEVAANLFSLNAHTPDYDELLTRSWTGVKTGQ